MSDFSSSPLVSYDKTSLVRVSPMKVLSMVLSFGPFE
uniref:Uncharacterized protein n=1 Tax=Anguilla anguilla TaxID=7936 RepID=A0A0E9RG07_ANGAN